MITFRVFLIFCNYWKEQDMHTILCVWLLYGLRCCSFSISFFSFSFRNEFQLVRYCIKRLTKMETNSNIFEPCSFKKKQKTKKLFFLVSNTQNDRMFDISTHSKNDLNNVRMTFDEEILEYTQKRTCVYSHV